MLTQEERLAAVEQDLAQFKTETIRRYQDFAMEFTITKALAENTIGRVAMMHEEMNQRFSRVTTTLDQHTTTLDRHTATLDKHTAILDQHTATLEQHTAMLTEILARLPEKS